MGNALIISETQDSPGVIFDREKKIFEIAGRSLPENTGKFYAPVIRWLEEYANHPNEDTLFVFKLDYFNSSSAKKYIEIISALERIKEKGKSVKIVWYHGKEDELMKERGEEMKGVTDLSFELKAC